MKVIVTIEQNRKRFKASRQLAELTPEVLFDLAADLADSFGEDCKVIKLSTEE